MNCISFPKMFKGSETLVNRDYDATLECLKLLLTTEQGELICDPDFGIRLKRFAYEPNSYILRDILQDDIFEKICMFCPQIYLERRDIEVTSEGKKVTVHIKAQNRVDFQVSTYDLKLFDEGEQ